MFYHNFKTKEECDKACQNQNHYYSEFSPQMLFAETLPRDADGKVAFILPPFETWGDYFIVELNGDVYDLNMFDMNQILEKYYISKAERHGYVLYQPALRDAYCDRWPCAVFRKDGFDPQI